MRYLSVCSGIEAATCAWHGLGWEAAGFSEIEPFPSAVLKHHYPSVPNLGDMTKFEEWNLGTIDLLVGGTPCQSFSVAGLRKGLDDPRGNLMLTYGAIAKQFKPKWLVWENVPGVLSSNQGRDFGTFLGMLAELGYGFAYRVLDAQYFGVAQRRRRVFVVGCLGDWRLAAAVLFERDSLCGNPAPSREKRKDIANCLTKSPSSHSGANPASGEGNCILQPVGVPDVMSTLLSSTAGISRPGNASTEHETYIPMAFGVGEQSEVGHCLRSQASKADKHESTTYVAQPIVLMDQGGSSMDVRTDGVTGTLRRETHGHEPVVIQPIPLDSMNCFRNPTVNSSNGVGIGEEGEVMFTITKTNHHAVAQPITFSSVQSNQGINPDLPVSQTLEAKNPMAVAVDVYNQAIDGETTATLTEACGGTNTSGPKVMQMMAVRRLTPVECERLQGFPDGYTNIPWRKSSESPDGPRYKALGNSMAVPVMAWIGQRIKAVNELQK